MWPENSTPYETRGYVEFSALHGHGVARLRARWPASDKFPRSMSTVAPIPQA